MNDECGRCGGTLYEDTDQFGRHENCFQCGASRVIEVALTPYLWEQAEAYEAPSGPVWQPYGRVGRR